MRRGANERNAVLALAGLLALAISFLGCGGEDGSDEDRIRDVAATYLGAVATADGEAACESMSESKRAETELYGGTLGTNGETDCVTYVDELGAPIDDYAASLARQADSIDRAEVTIDGGYALVQLVVDEDDDGTSGQPYLLYAVVEDGEWRVDQLE